MRLFAEEFLDEFLDLGDSSRTAHQDDFVDFGAFEFRVGQGVDDRLAAPLDQAVDQLFELGTRDRQLQVLGSAVVGDDEGEIDVGRLRRGQFLLGLLGRFSQSLQRHGVVAEIDSLCGLECVGEMVDQDEVEIVATELGVTVGAEHLDPLVVDFEDRHVECAAAEVEDRDLLILLFLHSVRQRRGSGLVDDPLDLETGNLTGVLGRLTLGVVEIGRHRDHRAVDLVAQITLGRFLQLPQNQCRDFRWLVRIARRFHLDVCLGLALHRVRNRLLVR